MEEWSFIFSEFIGPVRERWNCVDRNVRTLEEGNP